MGANEPRKTFSPGAALAALIYQCCRAAMPQMADEANRPNLAGKTCCNLFCSLSMCKLQKAPHIVPACDAHATAGPCPAEANMVVKSIMVQDRWQADNDQCTASEPNPVILSCIAGEAHDKQRYKCNYHQLLTDDRHPMSHQGLLQYSCTEDNVCPSIYTAHRICQLPSVQQSAAVLHWSILTRLQEISPDFNIS